MHLACPKLAILPECVQDFSWFLGTFALAAWAKLSDKMPRALLVLLLLVLAGVEKPTNPTRPLAAAFSVSTRTLLSFTGNRAHLGLELGSRTPNERSHAAHLQDAPETPNSTL